MPCFCLLFEHLVSTTLEPYHLCACSLTWYIYSWLPSDGNCVILSKSSGSHHGWSSLHHHFSHPYQLCILIFSMFVLFWHHYLLLSNFFIFAFVQALSSSQSCTRFHYLLACTTIFNHCNSYWFFLLDHLFVVFLWSQHQIFFLHTTIYNLGRREAGREDIESFLLLTKPYLSRSFLLALIIWVLI